MNSKELDQNLASNQKQKVVSADNETLSKPLVTFIYSSW